MTTDSADRPDWRRRHGGVYARARRVLEAARVVGRWEAPPAAVLLDQVEAGAIEAAAAGLRHLTPPADLSRAERRIWRRAACAAEAAMRQAAHDRFEGAHAREPGFTD